VIKFRLGLIAFIFVGTFGVVLYRAIRLQIFPHALVSELAKRQLEHSVDLVGRRGNIVDRNDRELAVSINSVSLFMNPQNITQPEFVAAKLATVLDVSKNSLLEKIQKHRSKKFVWIARQLNRDQMRKLESLDLKSLEGIGLLPEYRREYPQKHVGSQVLGTVSVDGFGLEGIERQFQKKLTGEKDTVKIAKDALGRPVFSHRDQIRMELDHGSKVMLTVDSRLQYSVEKILSETMQEHDAEAAWAIVMDPNNGEILAMANAPLFDPSQNSSFQLAQRRNRVITDPIEPGSVLKPFVVAKALDEKLVTLNSMIPTYGGQIKIGRKVINEAEEKHRFQNVSIIDLIRLSSNVGTVVLGQKLGWAKVEEVYRKLGFGSALGVELAAESKGIFRSPKKEQLLEQATMSFGQGIALTQLQIAQAYAVIANGGLRVQPHIVKRIGEDEEQLFTRGERVFSQSTSDKLKNILEKVVENEGTGILAKVEGFKVAGKTGTSQRVDYVNGGYEKGSYWSQFTGFVPANDPKFVISVIIDRPKAKGYYGGIVAAPAFSKIAQAALRLGMPDSSDKKLNISHKLIKAPKVAAPKIAKDHSKNAGTIKIVPHLIGLPLRDAVFVLQKLGLEAVVTSSGRTVYTQNPLPGEIVGDTKALTLELR